MLTTSISRNWKRSNRTSRWKSSWTNSKRPTNNLAGKLPADKDQHGNDANRRQPKCRESASNPGSWQISVMLTRILCGPKRQSLRQIIRTPGNRPRNLINYKLILPGSMPKLPSAKEAAPKPKTDEEISLDDQSRSLDNALSNHEVNGQSINIDEGSLAFPISGEKTFDEAGEAKRKAQDEIAKAKPRYRDAEGGLISKSQEDIQSLVNTGLAGHHESRSTSFKEVLGTQKEHESNIEGQKRSVFTKFEGIYSETKRKVNEELEKLNGIEETFQTNNKPS